MPIGWGLERKALANNSSSADDATLRSGVVPGRRTRPGGFFLVEDFFLIVLDGMAEDEF